MTFAIAALLVSCGNNKTKEANVTENKTADDTVKTEENLEPKIHIHDETERPIPNSQRLQGTWEIVRATGTAAATNVGTVYTFDDDKLTLGKEGFNNPGKTEKTDSTFSFQAEGNNYKFLYNYSFNGDTLVASMQNSNGQMLYLIKK